MTARFDLAALLAAVETTKDGRGRDGRVTLHFAYPTPDGGLQVRHVRRPVLLRTRAGGWVLRGADDARGGQVRTFRVARITGRDDTTLPPRRHHTAGDHREEVTTSVVAGRTHPTREEH